MKRILILGGNGFLGKALQKRLHCRNDVIFTPSSSEFNLLSPCVEDPYKSEKIDEIWHLAAWTRAGDFCDTHRADQWLVNQKINTGTLEYWSRFQKQAKLIACGTSASYASEDNLSEAAYMEGEPNDKFMSYAMSKRMLLIGLQAFNRQYGMNYLYLVPSTLYGPGYHTDGRQLHFIYDLIRKILNAKMGGDPVLLWGDGFQTRELVYVEDFVTTALNLNETMSNTVVNIGSGTGITIREFAQEICHIVSYDPELIKYDTSQYVGAKSKCLSIKRLNTLLPDRESTPLNEGLEKTIDWVSENLDALNQNQ